MNVRLQTNSSAFSGGQSLLLGGGLKSAQEKKQRQAQCTQQIAVLENQKSNLKNMQCDSLEGIAMKLDMLQDYDDQITAVKTAYNNEQMFHVMDEARERGEKIAEQAEKMKPKTEEERREEAVEEAKEALGAEESEGLLEELLEEATDMMEEVIEESAEVLDEMQELQEQAEEMSVQETTEDLEVVSDSLQTAEFAYASGQETIVSQYAKILQEEAEETLYQPLDIRV